MSSASRGGSRLVAPGEPIGVIEEFNPGEGVYVDENGLLRPEIMGLLRVDTVRHTVSVAPLRIRYLPPPKQGDVVLGIVTNVRHDLIIVEIHAKVLITKGVPSIAGEYKGKLTGAIPISQIADERIDDTYNYFRLGDLIVARTLNSTNPYTLSTREPQLGVVYAECAKCGGPLKPVSNRVMQCTHCGNRERRKVSTLAGHRGLAEGVKWWLLVTHT